MKTRIHRRLAVMLLASSAVMTLPALAQPAELEGVKLEPTAQLGGASLQLNGAGLRTRAFFKVYVAALYVPQKSSDAATLLAQKGPRRVLITMLRNVDADSFAAALNDGLKANHSAAQLAGWQSQIDGLNASLKAVGEARKGDVIRIEFTPDAGTRVLVNGQPRGAAMPGEDFLTALLRIWLGDKPADDGLKKGLLGG
jgi:Chalcone isomerase-like